jgi:hypothetical protein
MVANRGIEARLAPLQDVPLVILVSATVPLPLGTAMVHLEQYEVCRHLSARTGRYAAMSAFDLNRTPPR